MTDQQSPGDLPPERQFKLCGDAFKRPLDSMLAKGFIHQEAAQLGRRGGVHTESLENE